MEKVISVYKPIGMTPLQLIEKMRSQHPELQDTKLSYAGRLDPMAEGLLLILVGEENKNRKAYESFDKTYECEMIIGYSTDSYDLLGKVVNKINTEFQIENKKLEQVLSSLVGRQKQPYPPYSAVRVKGKPLFWWAKYNRLSEIEIPSKEIELHHIHLLEEKTIRSAELLSLIYKKIGKVLGDFRQKEIIEKWEEELQHEQLLPIYRLSISCSSGTYIRGIVHTIGHKLSLPTTTLSIRRIRIGPYTLYSSLSLA